MQIRLRLALRVLAVIVVAAGATISIGSILQRRSLDRATGDLLRLAASDSPRPTSSLDSVPGPVARYLRLAFPSGIPTYRSVRLTQQGELRTKLESPAWLGFEATHLVTPAPPGFLWNAKVHVAPLVAVQVRDALLGGQGSGQVSLWSAITVSEAGGNLEMNSGSLHRFLAEAVWYPTALLPGDRLHWLGVDDSTAIATLSDGDLVVSLEFRFRGNGEVASIFTPARWGTFDGHYEQRGWEGHFRNYQQQGNQIVPMEGEVGWYVGKRLELVWRGRVQRVEYDVSR